jgi:ubiquinone/menaquinone biosynthesis C-methylase UbiE
VSVQAAKINQEHTNQDIQGVFDEAATYYQNLRWFKTRLTRLEYAQTEQALLAELQPSSAGRYLEIGCGPGTWTRVVAERSAEVIAVDISANMLEQAKKYVGSAGHVTYVHGDAAEYQPQGALNGVFSFRVLEYVSGWQEMLTRVASHLEPGGRVTICTKTPFSVYRGTGRELSLIAVPRRLLGRLKRRVLRQPQRPPDPFWQKYISPGEMERVLRAAGFTDFRVVPSIFGLPVFMRGTCQYPLVPSFLERPFMWAFEQGRKLATRSPAWLRRLSLVFSEAYVLSATRSQNAPRG